MTYFEHFNFWLLFLDLKLRCPGIRKNQETYVAGGLQRISNFLETAPGLPCVLKLCYIGASLVNSYHNYTFSWCIAYNKTIYIVLPGV